VSGLREHLWLTVLVTAVVGVVIGSWSGAMGLGGGLLAVPVLVLFFGVELHTAEGTSLLMFIPNSLVGGYVHLRQGTASLRAATVLGLAAIPGTVVGALVGLALDATVLGLVFGTFALAMALREIVQFVRADPSGRRERGTRWWTRLRRR
jgi:hypothetical protein